MYIKRLALFSLRLSALGFSFIAQNALAVTCLETLRVPPLLRPAPPRLPGPRVPGIPPPRLDLPLPPERPPAPPEFKPAPVVEGPAARKLRFEETQMAARQRAKAAGLAHGGFGVVAREVQPDGSVRAVKSNLLTADELRSFGRDPRSFLAKEADDLEHLNADGALDFLPRYYGRRELPDGTFALVKEWVEGRTPGPPATFRSGGDYYSAARDAITQARTIIKNFARLNQKGFLFVDGKAPNLLLKADGKIVFVDTGSLARKDGELHGENTFERPTSITSGFTSPEAIAAFERRPHAALTSKSDIYSAGKILQGWVNQINVSAAPPELRVLLTRLQTDLVKPLTLEDPTARFDTEHAVNMLSDFEDQLAKIQPHA